jgi:hypothetical protein
LYYDGKTVTLFAVTENKYARVDAPNKIEAMFDEVSDRLNVDFPRKPLCGPKVGRRTRREQPSCEPAILPSERNVRLMIAGLEKCRSSYPGQLGFGGVSLKLWRFCVLVHQS